MGGKGGAVSTNNPLVAMQSIQAQQAKAANEQTAARLKYGVGEIQGEFEGVPAGSTPLNLSSLPTSNPTGASEDPNAGLEAQWAASQGVPDYQSNAPGGGSLPNGYSWRGLPNTGGLPSWGIFDPSGAMVTDATSMADLRNAKIMIGGAPGDTSQGGFQPSFYNNYRNAITGYLLPQEDQQYQDARSGLNYSLARAGQLRSGVAGMDIGKLAQQDILNQANIQSQADQQTGALRTTIAQDEQNALNQLYATEDPTVAANTAQNMVANADLQKPILSPMSGLFNTIGVGVGNAMSGFTNPYAYINNAAGGMGSTMTPGGAQTASGQTGSGVPGSA
jgi:hypothetical protein